MGMPAIANGWTAEMVLALPPDGKRYEVIDGELLVTPAPTPLHQIVLGRLYSRLTEYLSETKAAHVFFSPADVVLDPRTLVQPDLFIIPPRERLETWSDVRELWLVIEILSPSTARFDRQVKRRRYQRARIPEYWIVDTDARLIERWRAEDERPEVAIGEIVWSPSAAATPLRMDLTELFRETLA
jgi:Uma2 family endonuclease